MPANMRLLVGTRKGGFVYTPDSSRKDWRISKPILPGWSVYHMAADVRGSEPVFYAAANHWAWGRSVAKSHDMGKTWDWRSEGLGFPADMCVVIQNVWHVTPGHASEPGVVFAGTQPAGLFRSEDEGKTWAPVDGINRHPDYAGWTGSGGGDSCIHSIEIDPNDARHMYVSVSVGGAYETMDSGKTWKLISKTAVPTTPEARKFTEEVNAQFPSRELPSDIDPLAIDEMHKMRLDPKDPRRIWTQAHTGVFLSDDAGSTWTDVTEGLPSFHGFPIATTHHAPDGTYVVPLEMGQDNFRVVPGQFAVYRTRDSGGSWQRLTDGLPGPDDYESVYREGLDTDGMDPEGVYVGTTNGQVYGSIDGGDHWRELPGRLPPILSVSCAAW